MKNEILESYTLENYEKTGVSFPFNIFEGNSLKSLQNDFNAFEHSFENGPTALQQKHLHLSYPWAYKLVMNSKILDVVEKVLGPNILVHSSSIFCKNAKDPAFVSWHQDGFYYDLSKAKLVSAWVAISDSNEANGCLRVIPGSHLNKYEHKEEKHPDNLLGSGMTVEKEIDKSQAIGVQLDAGEMSLHHVNIIHGSNANLTDTRRIGFAIRYIAPEVKQKLSHFEVLLARGEDRFGHYELLENPPSGSFKECQIRQAELLEAYQKKRNAFLAKASE